MSVPETRVSPALPREGVDRCYCGAKYWDGTVCHSCGHRWKPWHSCAVCGEADPDFHDPTVHGGQALCEDCYLELRPA
jgi:hypothetical protein